jgi:hypothetical protein
MAHRGVQRFNIVTFDNLTIGRRRRLNVDEAAIWINGFGND